MQMKAAGMVDPMRKDVAGGRLCIGLLKGIESFGALTLKKAETKEPREADEFRQEKQQLGLIEPVGRYEVRSRWSTARSPTGSSRAEKPRMSSRLPICSSCRRRSLHQE